MIGRVLILLVAALGTLCCGEAAMSDELSLPREHITLVAPPFVHPHEQATNQGPKVLEFTLAVEEKPMVIDDEGTTVP
jgi:nitrite reductase (NO-forming)